MRTFIHWQGNKSKHLNKIIPYFPKKYNTYIEPFLGSGAVFLKLVPSKFIINDLNKDLVNVWECIRDHPKTMIKHFIDFGKLLSTMSSEERKLVCRVLTTNLDKLPIDSIRRASNFILLKHCAYLGNILHGNIYRFGGLDSNAYNGNFTFLNETFIENIKDTSTLLTNKKIYNLDYKRILSKAKKNDFVFIDPPYTSEEDDGYLHIKYNVNECIDVEFVNDLYKQLQKLDEKGVKWILTQPDTTIVKKLFKMYKIIKYKVYRFSIQEYKNELLIIGLKN